MMFFLHELHNIQIQQLSVNIYIFVEFLNCFFDFYTIVFLFKIRFYGVISQRVCYLTLCCFVYRWTVWQGKDKDGRTGALSTGCHWGPQYEHKVPLKQNQHPSVKIKLPLSGLSYPSFHPHAFIITEVVVFTHELPLSICIAFCCPLFLVHILLYNRMKNRKLKCKLSENTLYTFYF